MEYEQRKIHPTLKIDFLSICILYGNLSRKSELLSTQFAKNSTLGDGGQNPPLFALRIAQLLLLTSYHTRLENKMTATGSTIEQHVVQLRNQLQSSSFPV